jgi:hypothetical protein
VEQFSAVLARVSLSICKWTRVSRILREMLTELGGLGLSLVTHLGINRHSEQALRRSMLELIDTQIIMGVFSCPFFLHCRPKEFSMVTMDM